MTHPCGIVLRENNTILVVEIFHGAKGAKIRRTKNSKHEIRNWDLILCGLGVLARKTLLKSFC